jgi:hypothetical protein
MADGLVVLVAANIPIKPLSKFSFETLKGFWPQGETSVRNLFSSLTGPVAYLCRSFDSIYCNKGD